MVFTNVINPRAFIERKSEYKRTLVRRGASIGANATIVCGVTLGQYCFVGAGSVVTRDVPDYALVYGSPARVRGWACWCGIGLPLKIDETGRRGDDLPRLLAPLPPRGPQGRGDQVMSQTAAVRAVEVDARMNVPLLDLKAQYETLKAQVMPVIERVCASQHFILGPYVKKLEDRVAQYSHAAHCIGASSGTDALLMALMALDVGPGDEVHHDAVHVLRDRWDGGARRRTAPVSATSIRAPTTCRRPRCRPSSTRRARCKAACWSTGARAARCVCSCRCICTDRSPTWTR